MAAPASGGSSSRAMTATRRPATTTCREPADSAAATFRTFPPAPSDRPRPCRELCPRPGPALTTRQRRVPLTRSGTAAVIRLAGSVDVAPELADRAPRGHARAAAVAHVRRRQRVAHAGLVRPAKRAHGPVRAIDARPHPPRARDDAEAAGARVGVARVTGGAGDAIPRAVADHARAATA